MAGQDGGSIGVTDINKLFSSLKKYQENSMFHPLTCGNNSGHKNLEPSLENGAVVLRCPDCDYIQENIPAHLLRIDNLLD